MSYYEGIICGVCYNEVCHACGSCHDCKGDDEEVLAEQNVKTISDLRKKLSIKTAPNHGLLDLYRRGN
jgi:hypothetical protein